MQLLPRPTHLAHLYNFAYLHIPPASDFQPYDPLQQLTYAAVVFLLGPFLLLTGAAQSPAIEAQFPWYVRLFGGRQSARSLHLLGLFAFVFFIIVDVALVLIVHFQDNIRNMVLGSEQANFTTALIIAIVALALVVILYVVTSWYSFQRGAQSYQRGDEEAKEATFYEVLDMEVARHLK